jgi:hypothetical protein
MLERVQRSGGSMAALICAAAWSAACGGNVGSDRSSDADSPEARTGEPCWELTQPIADPRTPLEHACSLVIARHTQRLDAVFGVYARGEHQVYRGTVTAISDLPEHETVNPSYYESHYESIQGAAVARIAPAPVLTGYVTPPRPNEGLTLEIADPESGSWLEIFQAPGVTDDVLVSKVRVVGEGASIYLPGRIDALDLAMPPAEIEMDFDESGEARGWLYRIRIDGVLTRVAPDQVTVQDALTLDRQRDASGFADRGDELVERVERSDSIAVDAPAGLDFVPTQCHRSVDYALVAYVRAEAPGSFGVRDVRVSSTELCCIRCLGPECIDAPFRRECFE